MQRFVDVTSKGVTLRYGNEGYIARTPEEVPAIVAEKGAAILLDAMTPAECDAFREGMLRSAEQLTSRLEKPFARDDPSTYGSIFQLAPNHGGLFQHHQWGHIQEVWDLRQNPKLAAAHAAFHGCELDDLLTSFDGVNFSAGAMMPGRKRGQFRGNSWIHLDQRTSDSTKLCLQSWVTANPIGIGDATLRFLEGGHNFHREFAEDWGLTEKTADWTLLEPDHLTWFDAKGCKDTCLTVPAGAQVFWDSRTPHSGIEFLADEDRPDPAAEKSIRIVAYLCYEPRTGPVLPEGHPDTGKAAKGLPKILAKRQKILDPTNDWFLRLTSHWPNKMKLFGKNPRSYGAEPPKGATDPTDFWSFVPPIAGVPELTDFGRRVAGLD